MKKLLLVIDVQNDFINDNTRVILPKIEKLVNAREFDDIAFTRFINDVDSNWYKKLNYKGCINKEQQAIAIDTQDYKVFDKKIYSALNNELENYIKTKEVAFKQYEDREYWAKKMLINISKAGYFSSDRTIKDYNDDIWKL